MVKEWDLLEDPVVIRKDSDICVVCTSQEKSKLHEKSKTDKYSPNGSYLLVFNLLKQ